MALSKNLRRAFFAVTIIISTSSFSETICSGSSQNSALIVIDMQPYFVNRSQKPNTTENKAKVEQIIKEQVAAINQAKKANISIVLLEYEDTTIPISEADSMPLLKAAVGDYKDVKIVKKTSDGMFEDSNKYKKDLVDYLSGKKVGTLIITGANGGACVLASIKGALNGDCTVVAYNRGIGDFNFADYIYPYANKYSDIKPNCSNCSFKEISSIDSLAQYMVNRPNIVARPTKETRAVK